jgi:hypothetical protein
MNVCLRSCLSFPARKSHFSVPYYIVICSLSDFTIFSHINIKTARFSKKCFEHKMYVFIFPTSLKNFSL